MLGHRIIAAFIRAVFSGDPPGGFWQRFKAGFRGRKVKPGDAVGLVILLLGILLAAAAILALFNMFSG